MYVYAYNKTMI